MIVVPRPAQLADRLGTELAVSAWHEVAAADILQFATVTRDMHWVHTDPERARRQTPFGGTIAHGFFTLALVTSLWNECVEITAADRWVNYGLDRLRFPHPVLAGDRIRLRATLRQLEALERGGDRITIGCLVEIAGQPKPALTAEWIIIAYSEGGEG